MAIKPVVLPPEAATNSVSQASVAAVLITAHQRWTTANVVAASRMRILARLVSRAVTISTAEEGTTCDKPVRMPGMAGVMGTMIVAAGNGIKMGGMTGEAVVVAAAADGLQVDGVPGGDAIEATSVWCFACTPT